MRKTKIEDSNMNQRINPSGESDQCTSFKLEIDREAIQTTVNLFSGEYLKSNDDKDDDQEIVT